jgi:hypothetical protein
VTRKPKLTAWEKAKIVAIEFQGVKRSVALGDNQPDIDRRINRIKDKARRREQRGK